MSEPVAGTPEGGSPAPSATPTPAPAQAAGTPSASPNPNPNPDPAPGNKGGDDWERRFKGLTADLAKERRARQEAERHRDQHKAEVEAERRRVAALAGVNVPSAEEAELEDVRRRAAAALTPDWLLKQLGLSKEDLDELKEAKKARERLNDVERHVWGKHGEAMVKQVTTKLSKEYGELSDRQVAKITKAYVLEAQSNPEFLERHEAGDEKLIDDFVKEWLEDFYEPVKRRTIATEAGRFRPVPNGKDRSIVNQGEKKINVTNDKEVEDMLVAGFRERGGEFGRNRR